MDKELVAALIRIVILLPVVCGLAYLTVRFGLGRSKYLAAFGNGRRMQVLEQVSMGAKCGLTLVRVGNRYLLFAHRENCIILVSDTEQPPEEIETAIKGSVSGVNNARREKFDN